MAIYEKFVGQVRQNKSMTLEDAAQQLKAKVAPVLALESNWPNPQLVSTLKI